MARETTMPARKEKISSKMALSVQDLNFSFPGQEILNNVSFSIHMGEKVALVGPNGVGKTTLVNIIRGTLTPEGGEVIIPNRTNIGFLPQTIREADLPETGRVGDFIKSGRGLDKLEKRMQVKPKDQQVIAEREKLVEAYEFLEGYEAEREAYRLLAGLGLKDVELNSQIEILSGGQKTRLFLARVLFSRPNLLLLDEPTNHLDKPVLEWLSRYLKEFKGALLAISHDRRFLDASVSRVLRLNEFTHQIENYPGNYSNFLHLKDQRDRSLKKRRAVQEKELRELYKAINKWRRRGKRAKQAKVIEKRAKKLKEELVAIPERSKKSRFQFEVKERSYQDVLSVDSLNKSFNDKLVVRQVSFKLFRGECLAILGPNGSGKSTLLKMFVGELESDSGEVSFGQRVKVGYYAQEHEVLDFNSTVLEEAQSVNPGLPEFRLRAALGRFLFSGDDAFKSVSMLSPGERTRLALAKLMLGGFNTLILDEPTNHLDIEARKRLMEVISEFIRSDGTIIITSHDVDLLNILNPDKTLIMPDEKLENRFSW